MSTNIPNNLGRGNPLDSYDKKVQKKLGDKFFDKAKFAYTARSQPRVKITNTQFLKEMNMSKYKFCYLAKI